MVTAAKKSPTPAKGQKTLLSFFQKSPANKPVKVEDKGPSSPLLSTPTRQPAKQEDLSSSVPKPVNNTDSDMMPQLSTPEPSSQTMPNSSPTRVGRRSKRKILVMDSESEAEDDAEDSEDDWGAMESNKKEIEEDGDDDDDFVVDDDEIEVSKPKKAPKQRKPTPPASSPPPAATPMDLSSDVPLSSDVAAASLGKFAKESEYSADPFSSPAARRGASPPKKVKLSEDPERYKWLLHIKDADGHPEDHPDYDPRTLHVPNSAWAKFTPFEKQYWEVKQNLWNTVVFFKKGKFYELYENDAEIAHKQFDLKLAGGGRANMSLCGVPEMSFDYWASAFIAKGYKVARVDQAETALGKEMRDIANKKKEEKIIRRELSCVLTGGTLTDATMLVSDLSQYCMAIKQDELEFAACFVDTSTSHFFLAHFTDKSNDYPMLETLMAQTRPKEIIIPRGNIEKFALKIMKNNTSVDTLWETVKPDVEFWDASTSRRELESSEYFSETAAPEYLTSAVEESDLSASAVGGLLWYLRTLKLDKELLSLGQFSPYDASATANGRTMVVDGQTLQNLEIFANTWDGGTEGTLFRLINKCTTPFGKRRLRSWISHPLQQPEDIAKRADAVDMFMQQDDIAAMLSDRLVGLPDSERMISRVHAGSLRPKDFVRLVGGLERIARLLQWLNDLKSQLPQLEPFLTDSSDITEIIDPWMSSFDHLEAKSNDVLVPQPGVDPDFDNTQAELVRIEAELREVLKRYRKEFKSNSLEYRDSGKEIFLIEVPIKLVKQVPRDWQQMGATSKFKRFWSPEVRQLVRTLQEAQEYHKVSSQVVQEKMYANFCSPFNYEVFMAATKTLSAIDCLLSLARTSQGMAVHCRPEILPIDDDSIPVLEFDELRHPVATSTTFIPNDVYLGGSQSCLSLLTGANAAGKSTVLRTTSCAILLAQLGCHVPAQKARLTPVDRIMTRLGASDNIFAGKSTFHLELSETERILSESSARSFVVIDELGRGGSSGDGFAIAEAVLHHLATHIGCRGFFATHYATLYDSFRTHPQVKPEKMEIDVDQTSRAVTFLYKLVAGRSEGSFGMNVASMCGVSPEIVAAAERAATEYEHTSMLKKRAEMHSDDVPLGLQSDMVSIWKGDDVSKQALKSILTMALQCSN